MTDIRDFISALGGTIGVDRGGDDMVNDCVTNKTVTVSMFAFEADDDNQRQVLFKNTTGYSLKLILAEITLEATATEDGTNYSDMEIYHTDTPASGTDLNPASWSTDSAAEGTLTANTPGAMTLNTTSSELVLPDGEYAVFFWDGTAGAAGLDIPIGTIFLEYEFV